MEQELGFDTSLQIAYVANHGTRIDVSQNINQPRIYGQSGTYDPLNHAADGVTPTFLKTAAVNEFFLGYSTNYQSLQVQLTHRMKHNVSFVSAFTWGKAENYQTGAQDGNLLFWAGPVHRNYAVADFDRKLNYTQTITYDLPAGHDQRFFNHGPLMVAFGGWKLSAIVSAVSGLPFTISTSSPTPGTTQTVNQVGAYKVTHQVSGKANVNWFNTSSFTPPPTCKAYTPTNQVPCVLGDTGRNQFRGPAYFSDNVSLFKTFPLFREVALEARFDAFNATNTPAFALPNATYSSSPTSSFGKISSTLSSGVGNVNGVGGPRVLQAAVKITF